MGTRYSHLDGEQRVLIEAGVRDGLSQAAIAAQLGVHRSTVLRELRRGAHFVKRSYKAVNGERAYSEGRERNGVARRK
jgi:transposase, IS30 family